MVIIVSQQLKMKKQIKSKQRGCMSLSARVRKERASPTSTVANNMLKNQYPELKKRLSRYAKEKKLKTQKTLKYPCLIFKLIFSFLTSVQSITSQDAINKIFSKADLDLDAEIMHSYPGDQNFQRMMMARCHADIQIIKETFCMGFKDLDYICENLRPLYDRNIADQRQHQKNRKMLAEVLQQQFTFHEMISRKHADFQEVVKVNMMSISTEYHFRSDNNFPEMSSEFGSQESLESIYYLKELPDLVSLIEEVSDQAEENDFSESHQISPFAPNISPQFLDLNLLDEEYQKKYERLLWNRSEE